MTKKFCDGCGEEMDVHQNDIQGLPTIKFYVIPKEEDRSTAFEFATGGSEGGTRMMHPPEIVCMFNATNVAICQKCMIDAFKAAVEKL